MQADKKHIDSKNPANTKSELSSEDISYFNNLFGQNRKIHIIINSSEIALFANELLYETTGINNKDLIGSDISENSYFSFINVKDIEALFDEPNIDLRIQKNNIEWEIPKNKTTLDIDVELRGTTSASGKKYALLTISLPSSISNTVPCSISGNENEADWSKMLIDQSPFAMQIHNSSGELMHVNPAWEELFKSSDSDKHIKYYHLLEDPQAKKRGFHEAFSNAINGKSTDVPEYYFNPEDSSLSGRPRWLKSRVYPIIGRNHEINCIVIIHQDVSDAHEYQDALKTSEEYYRNIIEHSYDVVSILDAEGCLIYQSPSYKRIIGYAPGELLGHNAFSYVYPDDIERVGLQFQNLLQRPGDIEHVEFRFKHKDGRWVHLEGTGSNQLHNPAINGIIVNYRDVTEKKEKDEEIRKLNAELEIRVKQRTRQLQASNEELERYAYVVSHDLKTPLRGIGQLSHWIDEDYGDIIGSKGKETLALLADRVRRLNDMIDGILEYSRLGKTKENYTVVNLNKSLDNLIDMMDFKHVQFTIPDNMPVLECNIIQIEQVFQNLIENAVKYNDQPKTIIEIDYRDAGAFWEFSVKDNGPGVDDIYQKKIFEMFQTLENKDKTSSAGLGLAIVKKIVEMNHGKTWIESQKEKGAKFIFTWKK